MDKEQILKGIPEIDNTRLEAAMKRFTDEKSKEAVDEIMNCMKDSTLLMAGFVTEDMRKKYAAQMAAARKQGRQVKLNIPPLISTNKEGERFLTVFTTKHHIPDGILGLPFLNIKAKDLFMLADNDKVNVNGLVINPQSTNLTFRKNFVDAMLQILGVKKAPQKKSVQMTQQQFLAFARATAERGVIPKNFYDNPEESFSKLEEQREAYVLELFKKPFGDQAPCPYTEEDFDVMIMDITDDMTVAAIEMPAKNIVIGTAITSYVVYNPNTKTIRYFLLERGEDGNIIAEVSSDGKHEEQMTAPAVGSEITAIIDIMED